MFWLHFAAVLIERIQSALSRLQHDAVDGAARCQSENIQRVGSIQSCARRTKQLHASVITVYIFGSVVTDVVLNYRVGVDLLIWFLLRVKHC